MNRILYVGAFVMPDRNAAAHRVLQNAKLFKECGYNVDFIELRNNTNAECCRTVENMPVDRVVYTIKNKVLRCLEEIRYVIRFLDNTPDCCCIIGYNLPCDITILLMHQCKLRGLKYIADCTEWYSSDHLRFPKNLLFSLDSSLRMKVLNKHANGLIVISSFLEEYYSRVKNILNLPPLVDKQESIWQFDVAHDSDIKFIYSGVLRTGKDEVKTCVDSIIKSASAQLDVYGVTLEEYLKHYNLSKKDVDSSRVRFHGMVSHAESVKALGNSDYLFLLRENSRKNNAGYSTKLVETISAGTAVVATDTSDVKSLIDRLQCGYIVPFNDDDIAKLVDKLANMEKPTLKNKAKTFFDYRQYVDITADFLKKSGINA